MAKDMKYPCRECIVRACCTQVWECDRVIHSRRQIAVHIYSTNKCPDCGSELTTPNASRKPGPPELFVCYPCTKVFVNRKSGKEPEQDDYLVFPLEKQESRQGMDRLHPSVSRDVIDSINAVTGKSLKEKDVNEKPEKVGALAPVPMTVRTVTLGNPVKIWGQNPLGGKIVTDSSEKTYNVRQGDIFVRENGRWVSKYEQDCEGNCAGGIVGV